MATNPLAAAPSASERVNLEWNHPRAHPRGAAEDEAPTAGGTLGLGLLLLATTSVQLLALVLGPMNNPAAALPPAAEPYVRAGLAMAEQGSLNGLSSIDGTASPSSLPLPGYPAVVAGLESTGVAAQPLLLLQVAASGVCTCLVYAIALALLKNVRAALAAAAVAALHPAALVAPLAFLPDVMFALLVLASLTVVAQAERRDLIGSLLAGICFGAAGLVQPLALVLAPFIGVWMVITGRRLSALGAGTLFTIAACGPAGLWMLRNRAAGWQTWPHATPAQGSLESFTAFPWSDASAVQERLAHAFATHPTSDVFSRLALTPPDVKPSLVNEVLSLGMADYAGSDPVRWIAVSLTVVDLALLAAAAMGAALLLVRGRWGSLLLVLPLMAYFLVAGGAPRTLTLALQGVLVSAVLIPGLLNTLAFWRHLPRRAARPAETAFVDEPVVVRSGRPI